MNKVIEDGMVKVLYTPSWGSGFYTYNAPVEAIFDPKLIELIEQEKYQEAVDYVIATYPGTYNDGVSDLRVGLVPEGVEFMIDEYDGYEGIVLKNDINWITA